jgi:hypothetical protein
MTCRHQFIAPYRRLIVLAIILVLTLPACGSDSPEEQIKRYVAAGEEAVENRDVGDLKALISEQYLDDRDRTRRDLVAIAARYILTSKNIHILTRIDGLRFPAEDQAEFDLYAAIAGQNISDLDALLNMQADLYRFSLVLNREEREWKLVRADWRPASAADFF